MVDSKFFGVPFAVSGDKAIIPEGTQPSGAISYQQGYGPDYERDPETDPLAKRVPRDETNELYYQITNTLRFLQLYGTPEWYAVDDNGDPVSYPLNAVVRHNYGGGASYRQYRSRVANNLVEPGSNVSSWDQIPTFQEVQSSAYFYAAAAGTANALTASLNPTPTLQEGFVLNLKVPANNTSAVTLNVNGTGPLPVLTRRGTAVSQGELVAGSIASLVYRTTAWQLTGVGYSDVKIPLSADLNLYVATTGSDSNDGLTVGTPFATLQKAWDYIQARVELNGFNATVNVANGTYAAGLVASGPIAGQANARNVSFVGNPASPSSVVVDVANSCAFRSSFGANVLVDGFLVRASGTGVNQGFGLYANGGGILFRNIELGACGASKLGALSGTLQAIGPFANVAGASPKFFDAAVNSVIQVGGVTITFSGTPNFSTAIAASEHGVIQAVGTVFSGASGVTGKRYAGTHQAYINTSGGGASFFPGNAAGTVDATSSYA